MLDIKAFKNFISASEDSDRFNFPFRISYSQFSEDLVLELLLEKINPGTYLDIGAFHHSDLSNTRKLHQRGWVGVNVDANPQRLESFDEFRPKDHNLNFGVGNQEEYSLYIFNNPALSTTKLDWLEHAIELNPWRRVVSEITVPGIRLRTLLDRYFYDQKLNLLSIDIEGADFEALLSLDFESLSPERYPDYIMIETIHDFGHLDSNKATKILKEYGYSIVSVLPSSTIFESPTSGQITNTNLIP